MEIITRPKVLLACSENWDTLAEIPYVLHKGGCEVDVLCSKESWLIRNSYFHTWIETHNIADCSKKLIHLASIDNYDWIILADDPLLKLLDEEIKNEDIFRKVLPLTKIDNREILASKSGFSRICDKYSILSPKSLLYQNNSHLKNNDFQNINFPVLIKRDHSWGGSGILLIEDKESLLLEVNKTIYNEQSFIIQEYIKGKDIGVECLFMNGQLLVYQCSNVLEYAGNVFSATNKREYFHSSKIEEIITYFGEHIGINGFASMQFIHSEFDDNYYILESDLRPQVWVRYGEFIGNDFTHGIKIFTSQVPIEENYRPKIINSKTEVSLFQRSILGFILNKDVSILRPWIFSKTYWRYIPFYDKVYLRNIFTSLITPIFTRKKRRFTNSLRFPHADSSSLSQIAGYSKVE